MQITRLRIKEIILNIEIKWFVFFLHRMRFWTKKKNANSLSSSNPHYTDSTGEIKKNNNYYKIQDNLWSLPFSSKLQMWGSYLKLLGKS